jgi:hypothetical protein
MYAGLGWWSKKRPVAAVVSALVIYIILQVLAFIDDPDNLIRGVISRVIILLYLVKGVRAAVGAERIRRNFHANA